MEDSELGPEGFPFVHSDDEDTAKTASQRRNEMASQHTDETAPECKKETAIAGALDTLTDDDISKLITVPKGEHDMLPFYQCVQFPS